MVETKTYLEYVRDLVAVAPDLARALMECSNLDRALRYLEKQAYPLFQMDVIAQDEFSHDVLIPMNVDHGSTSFDTRPYLVFGVT